MSGEGRDFFLRQLVFPWCCSIAPGLPSEPSPSVLWGLSPFFPSVSRVESLFSSEMKRGLPGLFYACVLEEQLPCLLAEAEPPRTWAAGAPLQGGRGQVLARGLHVLFLAALRFLPSGLSCFLLFLTLSLIPILTSLAFVKHLLWNKPSSQH